MAKLKSKSNLVDVEAGAHLRKRRKELGISQMTLAEAIGLTFQQIQKYEKGTNRMAASRLQQIAEVLDVPPTYFFDGQKKQHEQLADDPLTEFLRSGEGAQLKDAFCRIESRIVRRCILDLIEDLGRSS